MLQVISTIIQLVIAYRGRQQTKRSLEQEASGRPKTIDILASTQGEPCDHHDFLCVHRYLRFFLKKMVPSSIFMNKASKWII
jgi:hypothetical protein